MSGAFSYGNFGKRLVIRGIGRKKRIPRPEKGILNKEKFGVSMEKPGTQNFMNFFFFKHTVDSPMLSQSRELTLAHIYSRWHTFTHVGTHLLTLAHDYIIKILALSNKLFASGWYKTELIF